MGPLIFIEASPQSIIRPKKLKRNSGGLYFHVFIEWPFFRISVCESHIYKSSIGYNPPAYDSALSSTFNTDLFPHGILCEYTGINEISETASSLCHTQLKQLSLLFLGRIFLSAVVSLSLAQLSAIIFTPILLLD